MEMKAGSGWGAPAWLSGVPLLLLLLLCLCPGQCLGSLGGKGECLVRVSAPLLPPWETVWSDDDALVIHVDGAGPGAGDAPVVPDAG